MGEAMTDPVLTQLATPVGLPGSGRLRYGAAMALYRQGRQRRGQMCRHHRVRAAARCHRPTPCRSDAGAHLGHAGAGQGGQIDIGLLDQPQQGIGRIRHGQVRPG